MTSNNLAKSNIAIVQLSLMNNEYLLPFLFIYSIVSFQYSYNNTPRKVKVL